MKHRKLILGIILLSVSFLGCSATARTCPVRSTAKPESTQETGKAMECVVGAISGQEMDQEKMKNLAQQVRGDKEAQSAVKSLTTAVSGEGAVVKYCPVDGKRYSAKFLKCPEHGVLLKDVEN